MIQAIIIDLDDTLCLTEAACFDLENEILAKMGRKPMEREVHLATWGQPLQEAILTRSPGVNSDDFERLLATTIDEYTQSGKLDSIPAKNLEALDRLIADGKIIMVLTSRTLDEIRHLLVPDHPLANRVKAFYYRNNTQFHKPDPRAFNELLDDHELDPQTCVYIGDSVSDAVAAKDAGLRFVASLESKLKTRTDFADVSVDYYIEMFPEVVAAVQSLEQRAN